MAAIDPGQARKKIATYGKPSRKPVYGYSRDVRLPSSQYLERPAWAEEDTETKSDANDLTSSKPVDVLARNGVRSDEKVSLNSHQSSKSKAGTTLARPPMENVSSSGKTREPEQHSQSRQAGVFDIPSSDDETAANKAASKLQLAAYTKKTPAVAATTGKQRSEGGVKRVLKENDLRPAQATAAANPLKRRRMEPTATEHDFATEHDDRALQRNVAMAQAPDDDEIDMDRQSKLCTSSKEAGLPDYSRRAQKKPKAVSPTRKTTFQPKQDRQRHQTGSASDEQSLKHAARKISKPVLPGLKQGTKSGSLPSPGRPSSRVTSGSSSPVRAAPRPTGNGSNSLKSPATPKRSRPFTESQATPPRQSSQSTSKDTTPDSKLGPATATTPRQNQLWNRLLDAHQVGESPNQPPIQNLSITEEQENSRSEDDLGLDEDLSQTSAPNRGRAPKMPRKRLIDSLEDEASNRRKDSDAENDGEEGLNIISHQPSTEPSALYGTEQESSMANSTVTTAEPHSSQTISASSQGGPKKTYSRERSYLTESVMDEKTLFSTPLDSGIGSGSQARRIGVQTDSLVAKGLGGIEEDEDDVDGALSGTIRSIHELRQAGGNKRFLDESETLLEDIEDRAGSSLSRRRNGLLELGTKLMDKGYARRFLDQNLDRRLFSRLDTEHDLVAGFVLGALLALLAQESVGSTVVSQARDQGAVAMLSRLLEEDRNIVAIAKDRRTNMSKAARSLVSDFGSLVQESSIWTSEKPDDMTPCMVSLRCFELLVRQSRERGDHTNILSSATANRLIQFLALDSAGDMESERSVQDVIQTELALSILESCTINIRAGANSIVRDSLSTATITDFLVDVSQKPRNQFKQSQVLTIRLILNVTNNNTLLCSAFGSERVVKTLVHIVTAEFGRLLEPLAEEDRLFSVDYLVLALATLINFAEWSGRARSHVLSHCGGKSALLDDLLLRFLGGLERAGEVSISVA